jgi:hypothetical protein
MAGKKLLFRNLLRAAIDWASQFWENVGINWENCDSKWEGI